MAPLVNVQNAVAALQASISWKLWKPECSRPKTPMPSSLRWCFRCRLRLRVKAKAELQQVAACKHYHAHGLEQWRG